MYGETHLNTNIFPTNFLFIIFLQRTKSVKIQDKFRVKNNFSYNLKLVFLWIVFGNRNFNILIFTVVVYIGMCAEFWILWVLVCQLCHLNVVGGTTGSIQYIKMKSNFWNSKKRKTNLLIAGTSLQRLSQSESQTKRTHWSSFFSVFPTSFSILICLSFKAIYW